MLFNRLFKLVIAFLPRSKHLFNFRTVVTICSDFGAQENNVSHCFHCFPICCHEVMGLDAMILVFWMLSFKPTFSLSSFTFIKRLFSSFSLSAVRVVCLNKVVKFGFCINLRLHTFVIMKPCKKVCLVFYFILHTNFIYLFSFIFISWRLITLQYCSDFCHTLTWISHGFTCVPDPDPPSLCLVF